MRISARRYAVCLPQTPGRHTGFTLIELIMVIVILGVLAVVAVPRIFNSSDFYARGFRDETLALLRFAQKSAIAQRRTVCVAFASGSVTLTMATTPATAACATPVTLTGPNGSPTVTARAGTSFSATPLNFNFNGLGQPIDGGGALVATQTIQITGVADVIVEGQTGYVH